MLIRELVTNLGFDVDFGPLQKFDDKIGETKEGLGEMGAAADEAVQQVKGALTNIRNLLLGFTVATAAGAAGLFALVKSAANAGDEINKTAPLLGFTTEEYQKYRYAAHLAGVENESFTASTQFMLRTIGDAKDGNEAAVKSFTRLGISVAQLRKMSTAEVFRTLSDRLAAIPDQATRISASVDVLGRSGARLGMFLSKGTAEVEALMGDVEAFGMFTSESAQKAEDFNDALSRVGFFFAGIKNELMGLFPVFTGILNDFREWLSSHREFIKIGLAKAIAFLTNVIQRAWNLTKRVVSSFQTLVRSLGGVSNAFRLMGIAIFSSLLLLLGPVVLLTKATLFMLVPFIRLHTIITLITFALSALMPIWALFTSAVMALAATKIVGWLIGLVGGYRALATAVLIPTLAFIAQAAALAAIILLFEDLTVWLMGGKSIIGEWLGEWGTIPKKLAKIWADIKAVFVDGGKFIAAVFRGDFKEAFRLLDEGMNHAGGAIEGSLDLVSGGRAKNFSPSPIAYGNYAGMGGAGALGYSMAGAPGGAGAGPSAGPGAGTFLNSYTMVRGKDGEPELRRNAPQVKQDIKVDLKLQLAPGTSVQQAEETVKIVDERLRHHVNHSLQQNVAPGG
jgi:hypothetical protein